MNEHKEANVKVKKVLGFSFPDVDTYQDMLDEVAAEYEKSMLSGYTSDMLLKSTIFRLENEICKKNEFLEAVKIVLIPIYIGVSTSLFKLDDILDSWGALLMAGALGITAFMGTMILANSMSWLNYYKKLLEFVKDSDLYKRDTE